MSDGVRRTQNSRAGRRKARGCNRRMVVYHLGSERCRKTFSCPTQSPTTDLLSTVDIGVGRPISCGHPTPPPAPSRLAICRWRAAHAVHDGPVAVPSALTLLPTDALHQVVEQQTTGHARVYCRDPKVRLCLCRLAISRRSTEALGPTCAGRRPRGNRTPASPGVPVCAGASPRAGCRGRQ